MKNVDQISFYPFLFIITLTFFCFFIKIPVWIDFNTSSTINFLDYDFILFSYISDNFEKYENSLIVDFVKNTTNRFPIFIYVSDFLLNVGIELGTQVILFYLIQLFTGFVGLYLILSSFHLSYNQIFLILCLFLFSLFSDFGRYLGGPAFYNKVTSGMMAISIGYLCIGFFLHNKIKISIIISSILLYLHPVHSLILLFIFFTFQIYNTISRNISWSELFKNITIFLIIIIPFIINYIFSLELNNPIFEFSNHQLWWSYMKAKTTNPFPLQDGLIVVLPSLIVFALTYFIFEKLNVKFKFGNIKKVHWIIGCLFILWVIQIFFTEIFLIDFFVPLALTRVTPYLLLFITTAYMLTIFKLKEKDTKGIWFLFLIIPVIGNTPIIPAEFIRSTMENLYLNLDYKNILIYLLFISFPIFYLLQRVLVLKNYLIFWFLFFILLCLVVTFYFLLSSLELNLSSLIQLPMIFVGHFWSDFSVYPEILIIFSFLVIYAYKQNLISQSVKTVFYIKEIILFLKYYACVVIAFFIYLHIFELNNFNYEFELTYNIFLKIAIYTIIIVFFIDYYYLKNFIFGKISNVFKKQNFIFTIIIASFVVITPVIKINLFFKKDHYLEHKEKYKVENLWNFFEKNLREEDMILVVPFWDARVIPIMPKRSIFVDWADAQYVIYDPKYIKNLVNRLRLIGFDIDQAMYSKKCNSIMQYIEPMCRKKMYEDLSREYNEAWRENLNKMKAIAPNLKYVILRSKYLKDTDEIIFKSEDLNILKID